MKKTIPSIALIVLFSWSVFGPPVIPAFAAGQFLQMPIRVHHGPIICAIEPQANPNFPTIGKQLLDETEYAVIDWKTKLNQGLGRHPVWNITLVEVPISQQISFNYTECDITIKYFPEPQKNSNGFIATGVTIPNFETGKTNIEIYYLDVEPNWIKKEWTTGNQMYYTYVDEPHYTGFVATGTQLDSTIRHEIGHSFGLGHYIVPYDRLYNIVNGLEDMPSIMIDTVTVLGVKHYDITSLDISQVKSIYGDGGFDNPIQKKYDYHRVHQISMSKQSYQPGEEITLNVNTDMFDDKSFAEILVIDSNNTMVDNFGILKSNSTIPLGNTYQKNEKYLAEIINPINGNWDFASFTVGVPISQTTNTEQSVPALQTQIPAWVKNNAKLWSQNLIPDEEFVKGLEFLANQGMVKIPHSTGENNLGHIPGWIKTNAELWSAGEISDDEFVRGLQYLTDSGIIPVQK
ncbi:MAG: hypothetical protein KGI05_06620 [Thaumarchaeota archaeon]|nr:hypothetical protein [Nitrososphaerota archaeon]